MEELSLLKDIPYNNKWRLIKRINKGFSSDLKYYIRDEDDREFFLRLSDASLYDRKKQEQKIISSLTKLGIPSLQAVDFGRCNDNKNVYILQTWINGEILETALAALAVDKQYKLGVEAGKILKRIHSSQPTVIVDWYSLRFEKYLSSYDKYKQYGISYKYEQQINEYIEANVHLLRGEEVSLVHGDYHVGNMILSPDQKITIIDYDQFDWKAPIEDFYKLGIFNRNISIPFCRGQIDGYTDSNPTSEFWEMYSLCMAMTSFLSLLWGKIRSKEMYAHRRNLCDTLVQDHNCFRDRIPKWYHY